MTEAKLLPNTLREIAEKLKVVRLRVCNLHGRLKTASESWPYMSVEYKWVLNKEKQRYYYYYLICKYKDGYQTSTYLGAGIPPKVVEVMRKLERSRELLKRLKLAAFFVSRAYEDIVAAQKILEHIDFKELSDILDTLSKTTLEDLKAEAKDYRAQLKKKRKIRAVTAGVRV